MEQAEKYILSYEPQLGSEPVPFGLQNDKWQEFKAQLQSGDELWLYRSPDESWMHLWGRAGICIVRKKKVIADFLVVMN